MSDEDRVEIAALATQVWRLAERQDNDEARRVVEIAGNLLEDTLVRNGDTFVEDALVRAAGLQERLRAPTPPPLPADIVDVPVADTAC